MRKGARSSAKNGQAQPERKENATRSGESSVRVQARRDRHSATEENKRKPLMVVEDHTAVALGLKGYLTSLGYLVEVAGSVATALSLASQNQFDLFLIDLNLPDGTGWDLLAQLTTAEPVRAIAMSGWGSGSDIARSKTAGFMEHLVKPMTPEALSAAIDDVMQRSPNPPG